VPTLAIVGDGYQDDALSVPNSLTVGDPTTSDNETGFRCVTTA
jgi:hypothetical protein